MKNVNENHFTVYSKPACVQCTATKREITKLGGTYKEYDLTAPDQAEKLAELKAGASLQMPVVVASNGQQWTGFRPDLIKWYMKNKEAA